MPKPAPLPPVTYLHECFALDEATGILTWRKRPLSHFHASATRPAEWVARNSNSRFAGQRAGCQSADARWIVRLDNKLYPIGRIIFALANGFDPGPDFEVDHRDGNPGNNLPGNLRLATHLQNLQNVGPRRSNKSGYPGVLWAKDCGKWRAEIRIGGRTKHLGLFLRIEDAYAAYLTAKAEVAGEFLSPHLPQLSRDAAAPAA